MSLLKKDSLLTHVLLTVGASVLLVVLLIYGLDIYTRHGDTVKVPDLRGKTLAEMQRILDDAGLKYEIKDSTFSARSSPHLVARSSSAASSSSLSMASTSVARRSPPTRISRPVRSLPC